MEAEAGHKKGLGARIRSLPFLQAAFGKILATYVAWLSFLLLFCFFFIALYHEFGQAPQFKAQGFFHHFFFWDAKWYLGIAQYGYRGFPASLGWDAPYIATSFFPLYPLLIRAFSYPFLGNYRAAALAISWISTLLALHYLFQLTRFYQEEKVSYRACLSLLIFPSAIFLVCGYSEAVFLLCAVASFYHARRSCWLASGIWGFLACLARPVGLAVFLAISLEALRQAGWKPSRLRPHTAWLLISPFGLASYLVYLKLEFGDFLILTEAEKVYWRRGFNPWGFFQAVGKVFTAEGFFTEQFAHYLYLVAFTCAFAVLVVFVFRRFGLPLGCYSLVCLAMPLLSSPPDMPLIGIHRYVLTIFPAFVILALWEDNPYFEKFYMYISVLGLAFFTVMFISDFWAG